MIQYQVGSERSRLHKLRDKHHETKQDPDNRKEREPTKRDQEVYMGKGQEREECKQTDRPQQSCDRLITLWGNVANQASRFRYLHLIV